MEKSCQIFENCVNFVNKSEIGGAGKATYRVDIPMATKAEVTFNFIISRIQIRLDLWEIDEAFSFVKKTCETVVKLV